LEESLWFRKGQEVEELVSISLDPDITIQENDQYVTIRGSLELTGEYKSYQENENSQEEGFASQKFVERVTELEEEGNCEFSHRFPVDITIPNNRIQSIYDIDVLVDSFDYSIPERSCLKLSAELTISGLYAAEQQQEQEQQEEEEELVYQGLHRTQSEEENIEEEVEIEVELEVEQPSVQSSFEDNFFFEAEARKPQEQEPSEVLPKFPTFNYQPQVEHEEEEYDPVWDLQEARSEGKQPEVLEEEIAIIEVVPPQAHHVEEVIIVEESSSSSSEEQLKHKKKKKPVKKKSMTLTEFFARKDERTAQTKLKICIVQKGDNVNSLADRYDVSVPNLLRVNNLELNQDVYEGQVLYIPTTLAKK
jgi:stage VI sporulation protein D